MKKAEEFYKEYIKNMNHIVGGSVAIKKQIPTFRETNDIDIMISPEVYLLIKKLEDKDRFKKSDYGEGIYKLEFDDDSKLDFIVNKTGETIEFDNIKYLHLREIIKHKIQLIEISISSKQFNEHNKHLKDLIFIFNNRGAVVEEIDMDLIPF